MIQSIHRRFVYALLLFVLSCEKITLVGAETSDNGQWEEKQTQLEEDGLRSEQRFRPSYMSENEYQGAINAVKKAYQLTDISFTPLRPIAYNKGTYLADVTYQGMIYSSVKETGTYVGANVSFHTFMTAIHNPRSKVYTEMVDRPPYHGTNCRSYYGTVCSDLVSFALGLNYICSDFVVSDEMEELNFRNVNGLHIADVIWRSSHVAIITDVVRDHDDNVVSIEISEAIHNGCRRYSVSCSAFEKSVAPSFEKVLRYKHLERNVNYTSVPEFVPVFDETSVPFEYNDFICVDKGDQSCYFVGEDMVLNILSPGDSVEVYKDGVLHSVINVDTNDIRLTDLDYGKYQARVVSGDTYSGFTSWIVVDYSVEFSKDEMTVYFKSLNSRPTLFSFCDKTGSRKYPYTEVLCRLITEEDVSLGYLIIPRGSLPSDRPYYRIIFATDYGRISTRPIKW